MTKHVLVLDTYRGVYYGELVDMRENCVMLKNMRHVYSWVCAEPDKAKGVFSLATHGPHEGSRVGPPVTATIFHVSKIVDVAPAAVERFQQVGWK